MENKYKDLDIVYKCYDIYALEVLTGKWRLPIIWTLSTEDSMRYNELKREIKGITNIMLTRSLQGLEAFGLVSRTDFKSNPPHVEYSLTDKCKEILPALEMINHWGRSLLEEHNGAKTLKDLKET
ncbi:MAG: winged helix-turn-helix transcriptional regulator [Coprobacillaceae bacterium]